MKANGTNSTDADFNQSVEATGPQFFFVGGAIYSASLLRQSIFGDPKRT